MRYLMIDRILEMEGEKRAVGVKNVTMSEDFLTHHFPQFPIMPGVLVIEAMVQLASWFLAKKTDFKYKGLLHGVKSAKFKHMVRPGDSLWLEVSMNSTMEEPISFKGLAKVGTKTVAVVLFDVNLVDLERLENVQEAKYMFKLLISSIEDLKAEYERERKVSLAKAI